MSTVVRRTKNYSTFLQITLKRGPKWASLKKKVSVRLIMSDTFCLKTRSVIENIALDDNYDKYFLYTFAIKKVLKIDYMIETEFEQ